MDLSFTPEIYILGNGAIGCLWAHHLKRAGQHVAFVSKKVPAASEFSFIFECDGHQCNESIPLLPIEQLETIKILLVCVKSYQLVQALTDIAGCISSSSTTILLQNGMGNQDAAESLIPSANLLLATHTHGAFRRHPHHIVYTGQGETMIGSANPANATTHGSNIPAEQLNLMSTLNNAMPPITWQADIQYSLWRKLAINAVINPLTAINNCRNGELSSNELYQNQVKALINEMYPVFKHYCPELDQFAIHNDVEKVIKNTATNYSSMHQDYVNHQTTEIDAITGYLLKCAKQLNITLPEHQKLFRQVKDGIN